MEEQITQHLRTKWLGQNIIYKSQMPSTNTYAKVLGEENVTEGVAVVTSQQTSGKGRRGRCWISPVGNCYFSMLLRPTISAECASRITLIAAMAVAKAVQQMSGLETQIKWPNDVVVQGKKLCGILTEGSTDANGLKYVVVGIGINVNQVEFDSDIQSMATSVKLQTGAEGDCAKLIGFFLNWFEQYYDIFSETGDLSKLMFEYNTLLVNRGKEVRIIEKDERVMTAIGIDETGGLLVEDENGVRETIISGEVSVRGLYGYV